MFKWLNPALMLKQWLWAATNTKGLGCFCERGAVVPGNTHMYDLFVVAVRVTVDKR